MSSVSVSKVIRVLLCDDHELVRRGLQGLLEGQPDVIVVGEARDAEEAIASVASLSPDVVVMDVRLPGRSGIEACREIRSAKPAIGVLMLTSYADDEALVTSVMAGASGFLLKEILGVDLLEAIRDVAKGKLLLDPSVTSVVRDRLRGEVPSPGPGGAELTPQERRLVALVTDGLTNREIGKRMHLSEKTVKNYVSNVLSKLGLARRGQVAPFLAKPRTQDSDAWNS